MQLDYLDILDLFVRFATVGLMLLLSLYLLALKKVRLRNQALAFLVCMAGYVLLTAPIENHHYGNLRGVLLFLTDMMPYVMWLFAMGLLDDAFSLRSWPGWSKALAAGFVLWLFYFFVFLQGKGTFHQINHMLEALVMLHLIYVAAAGLKDDLVDNRRKVRIFLVILVSTYCGLLLALELGNAEVRDNPIFSLANATVVLFATVGLALLTFHHGAKTDLLEIEQDEQEDAQLSELPEVPGVFRAQYAQLQSLIEEGVYAQSGMSISVLAELLSMPEHHLRELINKHLGFKNFSAFLNHYRIPEACRQLRDTQKLRTPVLTIALELGYGSIGPFNRAFKSQMSMTPTEYRQSFLK